MTKEIRYAIVPKGKPVRRGYVQAITYNRPQAERMLKVYGQRYEVKEFTVDAEDNREACQ